MFYSCGLEGVLRNMVGCNRVVFPSDKGLQHDVNVARIISQRSVDTIEVARTPIARRVLL